MLHIIFAGSNTCRPFSLQVRASDNGKPRPRRATTKVRIEVVQRPWQSFHAPKFISPVIKKSVMEDDKVGHMVDLLQAVDLDGDQLWYSIIGKSLLLGNKISKEPQ